MVEFPELFLEITIVVALAYTGFVAVSLIYLLIKDKRKNEVW